MTTIQQLIKLSALMVALGFFCLLLTASAQAEPLQNSFDCTAVSEIPQLECEALVALYQSTDGPNWRDNTGWLVDNTPCSWFGVTCEEEPSVGNHVTQLDLAGEWDVPFGLIGDVPPEIGDLSCLYSLNLANNELKTIPAEIGKLSKLNWLYLYRNQLSEVPVEIGNLSSLQELNLDANQIKTIPAEISQLSSLIYLRLGGNQLNEIPPEVWALSGLVKLTIYGNSLQTLPAEIGNLSDLIELNIGFNQLTILPAELWTLSKLELLYLDHNELTTLPAEIGNLSNLVDLYLNDNQLSTLPASMWNLSNLTKLSFNKNQLSEVSAEIGKLSKLTCLDLSENQLSTLPAEIGDLSSLEDLYLYTNQLSILPAEIWTLSNLTKLNLSVNQLSEVPAEIGALSNLTVLNLSWNQLSTIPAELWDISSLIDLNIGGNQLRTVSTAIGDLPHLEQLDLSHNQLSVIPAEIGNPSGLIKLWLNNNQLSEVPTTIGNLANLQQLFLYSNQLNTLPVEIWTLSNLTKLHLGNNQIGAVPDEIGNLSELKVLHLNDNQLSAIPQTIGNLSKLGWFYIYNNQLSELPVTIGNLSDLEELNLGSNKLATLPDEIADLANLTQLYLYDNQLNTLPATIGNLTNLMTLDLNVNQLSLLPDTIVDLSKLKRLSIDGNQLNEIPTALGNLTNLLMLSLSWSELSEVPATIGDLTKLEELYLNGNQLHALPTNFVNLTSVAKLDLGKNRLSVTDQALRAWMDAGDPDWASSQLPADSTPTPVASETTVPPTSTAISTLPPTFTPESTATASPTTPSPTRAPETPTATNTPVPTITPSIDDRQPSDDTCDQATIVSTNGISQEQAFHYAGDINWVRFDAVAGTEYRIELTTPSGSRADVEPQLHAACDTLPDGEREWGGTFGPGARLLFNAEQDGPVYIRLANQDDGIYGPDVIYQLSIRAMVEQPASRFLIIVAGRLKRGDPLQDNIHNVTDRVYRLFQSNGYERDDIYYLATDSKLTGYDAPATLDNLRLAITDKAMNRLDDDGVLTLYIMDHGERDQLYLDGPQDQILTPDALDEWLTTLEDAKPNLKVNVFIEACHIGSFIEGESSISKEGRVVITSSNVEWDAYASDTGAYFSDYFLTALWQGRDIWSSFSEARNYVNTLFDFQEPWLDADGDGIHNELEDGIVASQRSFAYTGTLGVEENDAWPPYIIEATGSVNAAAKSGVIRAEVDDDNRLDDVWAVIYPPSYVPQESQTGELVQEAMQTLKLQKIDENEYAVEYAAFNEIGTYRIVIHAEDQEGLLAQPKTLELSVGNQLYLPMINR